jgi:hypothetical protein
MFIGPDIGAALQAGAEALSAANSAVGLANGIRRLFGKTKGATSAIKGEPGGCEQPVIGPAVGAAADSITDEGDGMIETTDTERLDRIESRLDILEEAVNSLAESVDKVGQASIKNSGSITTIVDIMRTLHGLPKSTDGDVK